MRLARGKAGRTVKAGERDKNQWLFLIQFAGNGSGSRLIISLSPFSSSSGLADGPGKGAGYGFRRLTIGRESVPFSIPVWRV